MIQCLWLYDDDVCGGDDDDGDDDGDDEDDDDDDDGYSFSFSYSFSYGDDDDDDGDPCLDCSGSRSEVAQMCAENSADNNNWCNSECLPDFYNWYSCLYQATWDNMCPNNACDISGACVDGVTVSAGTRNGVVFALALTLLAPFALRF